MILVKASGVLILPLFWKKLSPSDFGVFALFQILTQFLAIVLDWGISGAVQRCIHEWNSDELPKYIGTSFFIHTIINLIPVIVIFVFGTQVSKILFAESLPVLYFKLSLINTYFSNFTNVPQSIYRSYGLAKKYSLISFLQFVLITSSALLLLYYFNLGLLGYVLSFIISNVIFAIYSIYDLSKIMKFTTETKYAKELLKFALPTTPAGVLDGIGGIFDRFFLGKYVTADTLGFYSISRQLAGIYNLFLVSLKTAWLPIIYKIASIEKNGPEILGKITSQYTYVVAVFAVFVSFLIKDFVTLVNNPDYLKVADFVPIIVLAYFVQGVGHVTGRGLDLAKKTGYYWIMYIIGVGIGIYSMLRLAPLYGAWGAAGAFFLSVLARELVQFALSCYFYPRNIEWKKFLAFLPFFILAFYFCNLAETKNPLKNILFKTLILIMLSSLYAVYVFGVNTLKKVFLKFVIR